MAEQFSAIVMNGPMLLAMGVALLAGLVSFASPCILPLIPGYVGYLGGMSGSSSGGGPTASRGAAASRGGTRTMQRANSSRVLLGTVLFVLGFTVVFVLLGVVFAALGARMAPWLDVIMRVLGVFVILMGLAFLGYLPFLQRDLRVQMSPRFGLAGAPLLGATFALGWTPCIGPTLAAVLTLSFGGGEPLRGGILAFAYCLGLGLPFIVIAVAFTRTPRLHNWVRRHRVVITRIGGAVLILLGLALVTGAWDTIMAALQGTIADFAVVI
ncbi:MAG TPA: cytochrome c biogenesis protein CcdA [Actinomycetaceae bacterium]|nr:cytochrome c biogenesis protein CcdA [Actinomycetaceae bacterium]